MSNKILQEMLFRNKLMNGLDWYCYQLCLFGLGLIEEKPDPKKFGLNDIHPQDLSIFMSSVESELTEIKQ